MLEDYNKIPHKDIEIFLGAAMTSPASRIYTKNANDMKILNVWEKHFQTKLSRHPYVIEQQGNLLFLHKERLI